MMDLSSIQAALTQVRKEREQMIALRRGSGTLSAQSFRVERVSRGQQFRSEAAKERRADVILMGAVDADVAMDDRFNINSNLYKVTFIEPNRSAATLAEAIVVE